MLALGVLGQVASTVAASVPPFLIPYLHLERGLSLTEAGLLASTPLIGTMVSLVLWGIVVDRRGERLAMAAGLAIATVALGASATVDGWPAIAACWFVVGIGAASTNSASGRLVVGWFAPDRRGIAMGIRQTALPLGIGIAAVTVPTLVSAHGLTATLLWITGAAVVSTVVCAALIVDPARPDRTTAASTGQLDNPYRTGSRLWRIHAASALLVVPQYTVWTFMLVWLIDARGWGEAAAGALVLVAQLLGAAGRIGVGAWTDAVGSRLRPMRQVAAAAAVAMLVLGLLEPTPIAVVVIVLAGVVTVLDNGMAFTAVAEIGGPFWSGRAMGVQNTGQYLASALVPPGVGSFIAATDYRWGFAVVALCPLLAIPLVPVRTEHERHV